MPMTINATAVTQFVHTYQQRIAERLAHYLPSTEQEPQQLHHAMRYAVLGNGKRIRPLLVYATGLCFAATPHSLDTPAAAVELIHAYSLIHDDLPAMDDDDTRRGNPSCHKAFGEATAILAGDALQGLAFELLAQDNRAYSPTQQVAMVQALAYACSTQGMVGGQQFDLTAQEKNLSLAASEKIHALKTGALITASVTLGAIAAACTPSQIKALVDFAATVGVAFQLQDDIFDADSKIDITVAKKRVHVLFESALTTLDKLPGDMSYLTTLSQFIMRRSF